MVTQPKMYTITWQGAVVPWPSPPHFSLRPQITHVPGTQHLEKCCPRATHSQGSDEHSAEDKTVRQSGHQTANENPAGNTETLPAHLHFSFPTHGREFFFAVGMHSLLMWCSREVIDILKTTEEIKFPIIFSCSVRNKAGVSDWVRKKYWSKVLFFYSCSIKETTAQWGQSCNEQLP